MAFNGRKFRIWTELKEETTEMEEKKKAVKCRWGVCRARGGRLTETLRATFNCWALVVWISLVGPEMMRSCPYPLILFVLFAFGCPQDEEPIQGLT
ncbi:unnamed protein product [Linum tenue]|uniref:Uncharacterized protein n=1 Tax=Linum tenue TaxID=586396 RepID=A0AAV0R9R2_9ROSI|nr:unnamed protein product [Linum tenue]CAI0554410.1 unnamed protein product [Linum tenue]